VWDTSIFSVVRKNHRELITLSNRISDCCRRFYIYEPSQTCPLVKWILRRWHHPLWSLDHQTTVRWWRYDLFWTDNGADSFCHNVYPLADNTSTFIEQLPVFENLLSLSVPLCRQNEVNSSIFSWLRRVVMVFVSRWGGLGATKLLHAGISHDACICVHAQNMRCTELKYPSPEAKFSYDPAF